jgi:DNA-binding transcriptional ArsR family regulator
MSKTAQKPKILTIRRDDQKRAIASPLRMELIGLFVDRENLSVADIAERMGRPASAIHYHVGVLVEAGLLLRAGERRDGRRPEALYRPAADLFRMEHARGTEGSGTPAPVKTMAAAFRMAEREMTAALADPTVKSSGPHRNIMGARMHARLSKQDLAELNRHLRAIEKMLTKLTKTHKPSAEDQFVSLTLALLPLRNREVRS